MDSSKHFREKLKEQEHRCVYCQALLEQDWENPGHALNSGFTDQKKTGSHCPNIPECGLKYAKNVE